MRNRCFVPTACGVLVALILGVRPLPAQADVIGNATDAYVTAIASCTGEPLVLEGTVHALIWLTQDQAGGVHVGGHLDFNTEGTGSDGTRYLYVGEANVQTKGNPDDPTEATVVINGHLVSPGPADNGTARLVAHLTVTPSGEVTVQFVKMEVECH
jgi:hypothetical protein